MCQCLTNLQKPQLKGMYDSMSGELTTKVHSLVFQHLRIFQSRDINGKLEDD